MNDNRHTSSTLGQSAAQEAKSMVMDDLVGRKDWQGSKLGYITGFSVITDGVSRIKGTLVDLASGIKTFYRAAVGTEDNSKLPAVDEAVTGAKERFEAAVRLHRKSPEDLAFMMTNSHRGFYLYAVFFTIVMVLGIASLRYGNISGLPTVLDVAIRFALIPALFALMIRYGYLNWIVRRRELGGFGAYLASGDIFPSKDLPKAIALVVLAIAGLAMLDPVAAFAQTASSVTSSTPIDLFRDPGKDDVFVNMLGYVVPGIGPITGTPTNGHVALGTGFMAFSAVLMLFSSMMLSWHVLVGVIASAYSGKVLGERWHQIWAPGRVVLGLGSLAPIANGYGAAQILIVYLIVWGGNLANTIWVPYLTELGNGLNPSAVGAASLPSNLDGNATQQDNRAAVISRLAGADDVIFQIARREICSATLARYFEVNGALAKSSTSSNARPIYKSLDNSAKMEASSPITSAISAANAWIFSKVGDATTYNTDYKYDYGSVCGSISVTVSSLGSSSDGSLQAKQLEAGARFDTARKTAVEQAAKLIRPWAKQVAETYVNNGSASNAFDQNKSDNTDLQNDGLRRMSDAMKQYRETVMTAAQEEIAALDTTKNGKSLVQTLVNEASAKGWATAGTYYITLGQVQGAAYSKATARPTFEDISPNVASGTTDGWMKSLLGTSNEPGSLTGFEAFWNERGRETFASIDPDSARAGRMSRSAESPLDRMLKALGTDLLMTTTVGMMADLNPFNPMKSMIDFGHLVLNIFYGILALMIGAKLLSMIGTVATKLSPAGAAAGAVSSAFSSLLSSGAAPVVSFLQMLILAIFAVGIIHAYVLPMVPFIQVLFFLIGMLTLLVEALIAAPLWAFFHVRMDGQELVDNVQKPGYMIAFNLILRPSLMILGLIMSMFVFGAVTWFISKTYTIAVVAAGGEHSVGPIGTIVMIVILTFLHYQTALRSFSLINQVPDRVSRWFGGTAESLGENSDNDRSVGFAVAQIANRTENTLRAGGVGGAARNSTPRPRIPKLPTRR